MPKTKGKRRRQNKTKKRDVSNAQKSRLVKTFFEILHAIKLYHWKTKSYAQHQATDDLHEKLSEQTDRFIEVLLGKTSSRINMVEHKMKLYDFDKKEDFKHKLFEFRQFLIDLNQVFPKKRDTDLMTVRDDMLESVNQFLYLFTLQ
jgi:AAA+ ATPase superfamily predicted ATPase|tara:strand:+ start:1215 stop:1652 length:438 start_codon:yes stop_codon:yes gene_type:complete